MENGQNDPRHFLKSAANISEAFCLGRYMGVHVEKLFINVPIVGHFCDKTYEKKFTLIRALFSNFWNHRIDVKPFNTMLLIDSEGIQHSLEDDLYKYESETRVRIGKKRSVDYEFESPFCELEGKAKIRGWLWFPALPKHVSPHRLVFKFHVFAPGDTSGRVEDHDTIEIKFDFEFSQVLPDANNLLELEA